MDDLVLDLSEISRVNGQGGLDLGWTKVRSTSGGCVHVKNHTTRRPRSISHHSPYTHHSKDSWHIKH